MQEKKVEGEQVIQVAANSENVFTKHVEPIKPVKYFFMNMLDLIIKFGKWVLDFVVTVIVSLGTFLWTVILGIGKGCLGIFNYFKRKCHQFRYNDWAGRTSYVLFGTASFKHGQIVNGIMYILFEVAYIILFAIYGVPSLAQLPDLGGVKRVCVIHPGELQDIEVCEATGNSVLILIYALLWLVSLILFAYIWNRSIESGYSLYRIEHYLDFEKATKDNFDFSQKLSDEAREAYKNKVSQFAFAKSKHDEIQEYLNKIEDVKQREYCKYIIEGTISTAYAHARKTKKIGSKIAKYEAKKAKLVENRAKGIEKLNNKEFDKEDAALVQKHEIAVDKYNNKTLAKVSNIDDRIKKANHKLNEEIKTYSCYCDRQNTINHDKYGKFNDYFKTIAKIDTELKFWNNYSTFVETYNSNLQGNAKQNSDNKEKIAEIKTSLKTKTAATNKKFDEIVAKRTAVEASIANVKKEYEATIKTIKDSNDPDKQQKLIDAKLQLVEQSTRLNRQLHDLPNPKMIKSMRRDEIKESKHAATRDAKYLKTNFTPEGFANQCVIDKMLIDFEIQYADAITFSNTLIDKKTKETYDNAYVENKINELTAQRAAYVEQYPDKFVGKPKTFVDQIKGLFNEKFHVTILFLPLLGILLFSILPLIFSILIAFTNYSQGHRPPTDGFQWVGFQNFITLFNPAANSGFKDLPEAMGRTLSWTLLWAFCATFSNYFLGIIVALMINKEDIKFKKLWRTIFVLTIAIPQFISLLSISKLLGDGGAFGTLWTQIHGIDNNLGFGTQGHVASTKFIIILVNIWVGVPYTILSTTGILMNIPKDLYESSKVDGAGAVTQFFKITLPYILFVTGPYLITQFVGNINNFNVIFFLTGGGPTIAGSSLGVGETDLMITFLYDLITGNEPQFGIASTIGIFIFVICAFFSIIMYNKTGSIQEEDTFQ